MGTIDDLNDFHQFAGAKLANGGADSLDVLLARWKAQRVHEESVAGIEESIAQYEAGESTSVEEAFADARKKFRHLAQQELSDDDLH